MINTILNKIYFFLLISAFFFACNDATDVGLGLIPNDDLISMSIDSTLEIEAYTYRIDSTKTSSSAYAIIGSYIDPIFGSVRSSFVTQTKIGEATDFSNAVLDSIVLYLRYKTNAPFAYGNTLNVHNLYVYEIGYNFIDSTYYSNFNSALIAKNNILATSRFSYANRINDSILSIKLSYDYGQRIISSSSVWTDANFNNYFNGIWIKTDDTPEDAAITLFDINSEDTKVTLYYKNSSANSLSYDFLIGATCLKMNLFNHTYNNNILANINNHEQVDTVVYVQGLQGLKSKILIPELDNLKAEGDWAVNRAELILTAADESYTFEAGYPAPTHLSILGVGDDGQMIYLAQYLTSDSYLGTNYLGNKYKFDITYRVQQILSGEVNNNGFYILTQNTYSNPSRIVLGGTNHKNKMKLILTLTKI